MYYLRNEAGQFLGSGHWASELKQARSFSTADCAFECICKRVESGMLSPGKGRSLKIVSDQVSYRIHDYMCPSLEEAKSHAQSAIIRSLGFFVKNGPSYSQADNDTFGALELAYSFKTRRDAWRFIHGRFTDAVWTVDFASDCEIVPLTMYLIKGRRFMTEAAAVTVANEDIQEIREIEE